MRVNRNMLKYTLLLILTVLLLHGTCRAQSFQMDQLERIKMDFLRGGASSIPTPGQTEVRKIQQEIQAGSGQSTINKAGIKFPTVQDVLVKSDVAHIDPATYTLGPGDQFSVNFYGMISKQVPVTVQADGTVFLEPAPPIHIDGLTVVQAQKKIDTVLRKYFRNFNINLQVTNLRTFQVEILGEVERPGTYVANGTMGVCDAIGLAGGLKEDASLRNIALTESGSNKKTRIDVFTWYFMGRSKENHLLRRKSTILVPLMKQKVAVEGSFKRTGTFEIVPGETLRDIVKMLEPATGAMLHEAKVTRINNEKSLAIIPVDLRKILDDPGSGENLVLADGDSIFMPDLSIFLDKITVVGELEGANLFSKSINRLTGQEELIKTGLYKLRENERVKDIVIALGGLTVQADLENARIERPESDGNIKVIPVDLHKLMNLHDDTQNLALAPGDSFIVPAKQTNIYMLGEIRSPGIYKYNVGNKIKEYVALAGGPTSRARMKRTKVIQRIGSRTEVKTIDLRSILTGNLEEEFELRPGDVIYVPYADIATWQDIVRTLTDIIVLRQLFK